mmetsp:Transcript_27278/g.58616  ORF Transcript_27278/g.58616 Transcript_27278/m.58616 type:complete len:330 (-) Transcript_27278:1104-2093(-)
MSSYFFLNIYHRFFGTASTLPSCGRWRFTVRRCSGGRNSRLLGFRLAIHLTGRGTPILLVVSFPLRCLLLGGSAPFAAGLLAGRSSACRRPVGRLLLYLFLFGRGRLLLRSPGFVVRRGQISIVLGIHCVFVIGIVIILVLVILVGTSAIGIISVVILVLVFFAVIALVVHIRIFFEAQLAGEIKSPSAQWTDQVAELQVVLGCILQQFIVRILLLLFVRIVYVAIANIIVVLSLLSVVRIVIIFLGIDISRLPFVLVGRLPILIAQSKHWSLRRGAAPGRRRRRRTRLLLTIRCRLLQPSCILYRPLGALPPLLHLFSKSGVPLLSLP